MNRPRNTIVPMKQYKTFVTSGRYKERLNHVRAKRQKLEMMETLISEHEQGRCPDNEYIRDLKRRANEVRSQLSVLSTVETQLRP